MQSDGSLQTVGIRLEGVGKIYPARKGSGAVVALEDINLQVPEGAIVGVIGRSGAGKSSLIRLINGLERPDARLRCRQRHRDHRARRAGAAPGAAFDRP